MPKYILLANWTDPSLLRKIFASRFSERKTKANVSRSLRCLVRLGQPVGPSFLKVSLIC
jgi:hypothetical protein